MIHWIATHYIGQAVIIVTASAIIAGGVISSIREHRLAQIRQQRLARIMERYR